MKYTPKGTAAAGGPLHGRMNRNLTEHHPMSATHVVYQPMATPFGRPSDLIDALRAFARHALATTPDLTAQERQFLSDMCRKDGEKRGYGFAALDKLTRIAPRAQNPHALEEAIRGVIVPQLSGQSLCVVDTYITESRFQAPADVDQVVFAVERTPPRRDAVLQSCHQHLSALRRYIDAVHLWTPNGRRFA